MEESVYSHSCDITEDFRFLKPFISIKLPGEHPSSYCGLSVYAKHTYTLQVRHEIGGDFVRFTTGAAKYNNHNNNIKINRSGYIRKSLHNNTFGGWNKQHIQKHQTWIWFLTPDDFMCAQMIFNRLYSYADIPGKRKHLDLLNNRFHIFA